MNRREIFKNHVTRVIIKIKGLEISKWKDEILEILYRYTLSSVKVVYDVCESLKMYRG